MTFTMLFSKSVSLFLPRITDGDFLPFEILLLCSCSWSHPWLLSHLPMNPILPSSSLTPPPAPLTPPAVPISTHAPLWVGWVHIWDRALLVASGQDSILQEFHPNLDKNLQE